MNAEMKNYVIKLLETYHDRERKIAVLRYDLEHPSEVGVTEQIEAMNYGSGEGVGHSKGHISNKTLYIALNYEEQAKQLNAESAKEIADELFILERRQKKLLYYISLLEKRQAEVVRMVYMEGVSTKKAAEQHGLTVRTIERIRERMLLIILRKCTLTRNATTGKTLIFSKCRKNVAVDVLALSHSHVI